MLQMFQTCDNKQFANVVTGDENWIYYFEPVRKFSNKIWASKHSRHPIIAKRSLSARKIWYAIFFSGEGVAIKVPMENGNKHHHKTLKRHSTGVAEKYYQKRRPVTGFKMSSTWQCPCSCLRNSYGVLEERKSICFASSPVFPRYCPL